MTDKGNIDRGLVWTGIEKILVYGVGFVQGVILARLLKPEDFGLNAMLGIFIGLGSVLAETGLGTALVVKVKGKPSNCESGVFCWNVGVALLLCALFAVFSPLVAKWYGIPVLMPLLCALSLGIVINATAVVPIARLMREQKFGRLSFANSIASVFACILGITLASLGFGVWAIAAVTLSLAFIKSVAAWCMTGGIGLIINRAEVRDKDSASLRELLSFGFRLTLSGMIHSVYFNLYYMCIGKMWNPSLVGLYTRGDRWARLPGEFVNESIIRISLPKLVNRERSPVRFCLLNAILLWPCLVSLWLFAVPVVSFVLGAGWLDCVPYLRVLLIGQMVTPVTTIALNYLKARGRADLVLVTDFLKKPIGLAGLFVGLGFGILGVCWAKVVSDVVECIVDVFAAIKARREDVPVDLVYCWCNGPKFEEREKCRFSENGELRYSILSVDRYAPWIRKVFVFVNDETVIPDWLREHPKVTIVRHSDIIPKEILPLYNPAAIELWMNRIPGLSEYFIYGNDDMFFGRKVRKSDFFDCKGRMLCRYLLGVSLKESLRTGHMYERWLENNRKLLGSDNDWLPHHNFDPYRKSVLDDFWRIFPKEALVSASYKERTPEQLQREVFSLFAIKIGRGVYGSVRHCKIFWISLYAELCDIAAMARIRRIRPKMFCLNDSERSSDEDRLRMVHFLRDFYGE